MSVSGLMENIARHHLATYGGGHRGMGVNSEN